ncbi:ABC transporter substrate-binding protein [Halotalea alkalilenta]|uniref:ABC transporter substrate-binding protein n=1 Tax=Halotalea alkalilenta TaxID=376489 RepID=A0A172YDL6_9GAMM|nr:ABC transporter substrate-binding protein [Halotalea alkalilenta]ANF57349.1 ABC transporter substrate-binding protein [Halotalea alkalilenta]
MRNTYPNGSIPPLLTDASAGLSRRDTLKLLGMAGVLGASMSGGSLIVPSAQAASPEAATPRRGGSIRVASDTISTLDQMDPAKGSNNTDYVRMNMFYNGLTAFDDKLQPQPALAESFETLDNGTTWRFILRAGVSFHNGKPLDAQDVVFSLSRHQDPNTASKAMTLAQQFKAIEATGEREVMITLSAPDIELPSILGVPHMLIVPAGTEDFSLGIGTGPFKCQEFTPGVRTVAVRYENYWRSGHPFLDQVELVGISDEPARVNALLAGDVQLISSINPRTAKRLEQDRRVSLLATNAGTYTDLIMHTDAQPFSDPRVREAIKLLFDRETINRSVFQGYAVIGNDQPIMPGTPYYFADLPQRTFDPDRARSLLAEAGVAGARLSLVASPAAESSLDIAAVLQQSALSAGIQININRVPGDGYWDNHWLTSPFAFGNIIARPTANILLTQFFKSDAPWNESRWRNPQFDQLLSLSRAESDEARRKQMYADMQTLIHEQSGIGIPAFISTIDAHHPSLKGYGSIPLGGFMGFMFAEHVWLEG